MVKKKQKWRKIGEASGLALMIVCAFFGVSETFAITIIGHQEDLDPQYEKCVARVLRHPLRKVFSHQTPNSYETSSQFLDDTDGVCRCIGKLERQELTRSQNESLAYFFSGRAEFFSELDSCLLSNASEKNYSEFNAIFSYDHLVPLIEIRLKDLDPPSVSFVRGRLPSQALNVCMVEKVMEDCQKIKSLFFTYKCLNKKMKDLSHYQGLKSQCLRGDMGELEQGQKI